jgi:murein L,D-transpeptidase YcbB/YkuD
MNKSLITQAIKEFLALDDSFGVVDEYNYESKVEAIKQFLSSQLEKAYNSGREDDIKLLKHYKSKGYHFCWKDQCSVQQVDLVLDAAMQRIGELISDD